MKKTQMCRALAPAVFMLAVLAGCALPFLEKPRETSSSDIPEGFGALRVSLVQGAARTVMPQADLAALHLEYRFARDGGAAVAKEPEGGIFILEPGVYTLEVKAFVDGGHNDLAAQGDAAFAIVVGANPVTVDVALRPAVSGEGTGSLEFSLEYPAGTTVETFALTRIAGDEDPVDLAAAGTPSGSGPVVLAGTKTGIPVGYYLLRVALINADGVFAGRVEAAHIYRNLGASVNYAFAEDDFRFFWVNAATDEGPGSLRQAIADASVPTAGPQIIQVSLPPGSVVELEKPLRINKSINIEGNGVTLTRAASWTDSSASSQLMIISPQPNTANVVIRRVHFKDGLATEGAAIRSGSGGTLTLESCIFSGNRLTYDSGAYYGGAIYHSGADLTVRGCTFYKNTGSHRFSYGGAIYFSSSGKTLTLTGNLFYGNTAGQGQAVYRSLGSIDSSYNVMDTIEWGDAGTGNALIYDLPVAPLSFKVLHGSRAANRLPAALPAGYPAMDFYGGNINGGGAAGAAQGSVVNGGYYLELSLSDSLRGTVTSSLSPDEDGLVQGGPVAITAAPNAGDVLESWLINGVSHTPDNPLNITLSAHTRIEAVFRRDGPAIVTIFTDGGGSETTPGTLRYALANALEGDRIIFEGVNPGETAIELQSPLPEITTSMVIEGSGVTLTPAASWAVSESSQLLRIGETAEEVTIRRVRFKDGRARGYGGAIYAFEFTGGFTQGTLTLESCIFSGNRVESTAYGGGAGGAVHGGYNTIIRGCTFYMNNAEGLAGAVRSTYSTLTGNLFYGNAGSESSGNQVVLSFIDAVSYNVVDKPFGIGAGWGAGTGDALLTGMPVSPVNFRLLAGSGAANRLPATLPPGYPKEDFYGDSINGGGAAGAAQSLVANPGFYYLDLSVNNSAGGIATAGATPNEEGLYAPSGSVAITATPSNTAYSLGRWLVNGVDAGSDNPLSINLDRHTQVQAVFNLGVNNFSDELGSALMPGTLRYALTNARADEVIAFIGVSAGTTIELERVLPTINKNLTLEGNGVTLTRAASWITVGDTSPLLNINAGYVNGITVTIRRVHFKDGRTTYSGGGIKANIENLILESCIFSGNQTLNAGSYGGAIYNVTSNLTIRGCTFYNNTTGSTGGGAVYFSGSSNRNLTMTGNLFYGNDATGATSHAAVVEIDGNGHPSSSYNVVDKAFGTGAGLAGWVAGPGDTTFGALLIAGDPLDANFAPVSGLGSVLPPARPEDFPATDFYGAVRTFPGAPGAVAKAPL